MSERAASTGLTVAISSPASAVASAADSRSSNGAVEVLWIITAPRGSGASHSLTSSSTRRPSDVGVYDVHRLDLHLVVVVPPLHQRPHAVDHLVDRERL